jgi:acetyltransferase-like isoleucine patch superfamily enzyme
MNKPFFVHPSAIVESDAIGEATRVWAFSHVMKGAVVGCNCNVGEQCYIESGVRVGNDVVIKNGVALWEGITIEDRVFLGPSCVFTNDSAPRSKLYKTPITTLVREGASIGANATILCGIEIGYYAMIGAGAVVTRSVPAYAVVRGNPARLSGFVCRCGKKLKFGTNEITCSCGLAYEKDGDRLRAFGSIAV